MASTRKSRVSDTNTGEDTHQHQRSTSHMASTTDENADTGAQPVVEIADSADEYSPRPGSPTNRSTKGFCKKCSNIIGEFYNSWSKVTGSYYVPALLGSYSTALRPTGKQKAASKGTDLEGW
jgi:hypothetical protein